MVIIERYCITPSIHKAQYNLVCGGLHQQILLWWQPRPQSLHLRQILMYHAHKKVVKQSKIWLWRRINNMPQKQQSYWRRIRVPCPLYIFKLGTDNESTHLNKSHHFHQAAHSVVTCFIKTCLFNICKRLTICKNSLFFKFLCMQNKEFSKSTWIIIRK